MTRSPMNRMARIDLSRVPSSMELMAAGWAGRGDAPARCAEPVRLPELLARDQARLAAHADELARGANGVRP